MKELNYEDWLKNPTPREMWVWDEDKSCKVRRKVIYINKVNKEQPVIALTEAGFGTLNYAHCAEIESKRMTKKELSRWLREKPTREYKDTNNFSSIVYGNYSYMETESSDKVPDNILIREDDGEWQEPLVEIE